LKSTRTDYWSDYAPEPAIILYRGNKPSFNAFPPDDPNAFFLWEGFFDPIHTALLDRYGHDNMPLEFIGWNECKGWYDGGAETLSNPDLSADRLTSLTRENLRSVSNDSYAEGVEECIADLARFLRESVELDISVSIRNGFPNGYIIP